MHLQIISLGAGVQSTALLILNTLGRVEPRATHAIFADTGGEFESRQRTLLPVSRHRPLCEAFSTDQIPLFPWVECEVYRDPDNQEDEECGGYCFT